MDFRILGPLEVCDDEGRPVELAAGRQRTLVALLLLRANQVVSTDRLTDALWGERPPDTAAKALQGLISALRKSLGAERVETRAPGYLLRVGPGEVDASRFEQLAPDDPGAALALWRGEPLADFAYADFARAEIERLDELRLACLETRIDQDLAGGRHRELVAELERLVTQHPLRERFRAQLMLALYRSGRQADALDSYRSGRQALVDELGIEPSAELRELEQAILRQDTSISAPPQPRPLGGGRKRRLVVGAAGLVALAGVLAGGLAAIGRGGPPEVVPNSVIAIAPSSNHIRTVIPIGRRPDQILALGNALFVASPLDGTVMRIDTRTKEVVTARGLAEPATLAVAAGRLWVGGVHSTALTRFEPRSLRPIDRIPVGGAGTPWLATAPGSLWVVQPNPLIPLEEQVLRLASDSGSVRQRFKTGAIPSEVAVGGGAAWVSNYGSGTISRIDAKTGTIDSFRVDNAADLEYAYGALWVLTVEPNTVRRVDPRTLITEAILPVGRCPWQIAAGADAIWTTNCHDGTVTRIDPHRNEVAATIRVGHRPLSVSVGRDAVWVGVAEAG